MTREPEDTQRKYRESNRRRMTAPQQPDEMFDRIFKAINDSRTNLGKEFTTGYETDEHDLPIISDEFDELFTKIEAIRQSAQQPPFQNPLAKENLTVGMIYAYEAGLEDGKKQPPAPAAALQVLDELKRFVETDTPDCLQGESDEYCMRHDRLLQKIAALRQRGRE